MRRNHLTSVSVRLILLAAALFCWVAGQASGQSICVAPAARAWVIVEDVHGGADTVWFGFDSSATRGKDPRLCEYEYPDIPPINLRFLFPIFYAESEYEWGMKFDYRPFGVQEGVDTFSIHFGYRLDSTFYPIRLRWQREAIERFCDSAVLFGLASDDRYVDMAETDSFVIVSPPPFGVNIYVFGARDSILTDVAVRLESPREYALLQNYPNPFNPSTSITYIVPRDGHVSLAIYDLLGREIQRLVHENKHSGRYSVAWDAENLASGAYLCRLVAGQHVETRKMVYLR